LVFGSRAVLPPVSRISLSDSEESTNSIRDLECLEFATGEAISRGLATFHLAPE
jgi:hypothetical protein